MIKCWAILHYKEPEGSCEELNQVLWFNSEIKIGKKVFLWKKWFKYGIVYVKYIVTKGFNFMDISEIKNKFNVNLNWFEYYKLISAIPVRWKSNFSENKMADVQPFVDHVFSILDKCDCNKIICDNLLEKVCVLPNRIMEKWDNLIVDHGYDWAGIFSISL